MNNNARILGKPPHYQAYLLRCYEAPNAHLEQPATWRFTLEDSRTGERQGFADLDLRLIEQRLDLFVRDLHGLAA